MSDEPSSSRRFTLIPATPRTFTLTDEQRARIDAALPIVEAAARRLAHALRFVIAVWMENICSAMCDIGR